MRHVVHVAYPYRMSNVKRWSKAPAGRPGTAYTTSTPHMSSSPVLPCLAHGTSTAWSAYCPHAHGLLLQIPGQHRSCWGQDLLRPGRYPRLAEDVEADVVVVGGGLAGLATAYRLAKAGEDMGCR